MVIDNSESMGIGATAADQSLLYYTVSARSLRNPRKRNRAEIFGAEGEFPRERNTIFEWIIRKSYYNNGGCALACHYPGQDSATPMRALGATLRIDAEQAAVHAALASIPSGSTYQAAIYAMSDKLTKTFALSNNVTAARQVVAPIAQNASGLDLANDANNGGADFPGIMSLFNALPRAATLQLTN